MGYRQQGLAGSDLKAALAGGAAPYVAEVIKQYSPNETSRVMAHAVMAGVAAELQGNNAAAGAAGAATAAIGTSVIAKALFGGEFIGNKIKDKINEKDANHDEK